jgi:hypothetical protein
MTRLVNCTPHELRIRLGDGEFLTLPPSGDVARCAETRVDCGWIEVGSGQEIVKVSSALFGEVTGLPEPEYAKVFVVSLLVAQAVKGDRADVYATGPAIRDAEGRIIGCNGLSLV